MKKILIAIVIIGALAACSKKAARVTDPHFIDSILSDYKKSPAQEVNEKDIQFWKDKLAISPTGYIENIQYASNLANRFHLYGDIRDIKVADSMVRMVNLRNKSQDAGTLRSLASYAILQHRFPEAADLIQKALQLGSERYASELMNFDASFELGQNMLAKSILEKLESTNEYGYFFRLAKYKHLEGELDSAIAAMTNAAELAGNHTGLEQAALSNTADLYMHAADPGKANGLYMKSIKLDASDLHSLVGIGWIALVHDRDDSLAERVFKFVQGKTRSPELLLKLFFVAEQRGDSIAAKQYAGEFVQAVSAPLYGNMYNKYLVDLYTGFLQEPARAVKVSANELDNRATPQTYCWYVWSLYQDGQKDKALELYNKYVSGKPLEGPELYYMGKMMQGLGKGYNAEQYFKAAYRNRYDLGPAKQKELETIIGD